MKTYRPLEHRPSGLWLVAGWFAAVGIMGALQRCDEARGSEPLPPAPPVIAPMPARRPSPPAEAPRHTAPADGPMCRGVEIDPPPSTHFGLLVSGEIGDDERQEIETQIARCSRFRGVTTHRALRDPPDAYALLALWRHEADLGVPREARGILAAAWCWESALRQQPHAGDIGKSVGPFQMQAWMWAWCGQSPSRDIVAAASCYWSRVQHYLDDGTCPGGWERAEAMAANGVKYGAIARGRASFRRSDEAKREALCSVRSLHADELARWRKQ